MPEKWFFVNFLLRIRILPRTPQVARQVSMSESFSRKHLSAEGLLREARRVFAQVPDAPGHDIPLVD